MPTATEATNLVSKAANSNEPARPRLAAVDGLRPLLTMWVIIFHLGVPKSPTPLRATCSTCSLGAAGSRSTASFA